METAIYLTAYQPPDTPTFADVPATHPIYAAVEAASEMGFSQGYSDGNGDPTGNYGPNDFIGRHAASKVIFNAFGLQENLDPPPTASDVEIIGWYYNYVTTLINEGVVEYYSDGSFAPSDNASSCFVNLAIERAEEFLPEPPEPARGTVAIEAGTTPGQPAIGETDAEVASFQLQPDIYDMELSGITLTNCGTLASSNMSNLRLLRGAFVVASTRAFVGDKVTFDV